MVGDDENAPAGARLVGHECTPLLERREDHDVAGTHQGRGIGDIAVPVHTRVPEERLEDLLVGGFDSTRDHKPASLRRAGVEPRPQGEVQALARLSTSEEPHGELPVLGRRLVDAELGGVIPVAMPQETILRESLGPERARHELRRTQQPVGERVLPLLPLEPLRDPVVRTRRVDGDPQVAAYLLDRRVGDPGVRVRGARAGPAGRTSRAAPSVPSAPSGQQWTRSTSPARRRSAAAARASCSRTARMNPSARNGTLTPSTRSVSITRTPAGSGRSALAHTTVTALQ